jgi:hypothetical protein
MFVSEAGIDQRCFAVRARRDVVCRLGMPTRANATHAGGSLAGKVSIRLSTISSSSVISSVSIFRKGRAFARPLFFRWCGGPAAIEIGLSGCSDRPGAGQFMLARAKLEGEYHQRDAKNQGVGPQPPGEHDSSDQRRDDEEHAIGERQ